MPIALRCLPFRHAGQAAGSVSRLEIATDLDADDDAVVLPLLADNGRMHQDLAGVVSLLDRLEERQDLPALPRRWWQPTCWCH